MPNSLSRNGYGRTALWGSGLTFAGGMIFLLGWVLIPETMADLRADHYAMSPGAAIMFMLVAGSLVIAIRYPDFKHGFYLSVADAFAVIVFSALGLADYLARTEIHFDDMMLGGLSAGNAPAGRISPDSLAAFVTLGLSLGLYLLARNRWRVRALAAVLALIICGNGFVLFLGFLYGVPFLHNQKVVPMSAASALTFMVFSVATIAAIGPRHWPLSLFAGDSTRARLMRTFLPLFAGVVFLEEFLDQALLPRVANVNEALLKFVIAVPLFVSISYLIFYLSRVIGVAVDRANELKVAAEKERESSEQKYRHLFESLNDAALLADAETGIILEVNRQAEVLLGRPRDEIVGMHQSQVHPSAKSAELRRRFAESARMGIVSVSNAEIIRRDGTVVPVDISGSNVALNGKPARLGIFRDVSQIRQAQDRLYESEERYRTLVEAAQDAIFIVDPQGKLIYINEMAARIIDYSASEAVGMSVSEVLPPDPGGTREQALRSVFETGELSRTDSQFTFPGGELWLNTTLTPIRGRDGRVASVLGISRDITERRRAEAITQESERRYRELFEESPVSLWEEDCSEVRDYIEELRAGGVGDFEAYFIRHPEAVRQCAGLIRILNVNKATLDLYNAGSKSEMLANLEQVFAPDSYSVFQQGLVAIADGKSVIEGEAQTRKLTGEIINCIVKWSVIPVPADRVVIIVSVTDITAIRLAEQALLASEAEYRSLFEEIQDMVFISTPEGELLDVNPAGVEMLGYGSQQELLALDMGNDIYVNPGDREAYKRAIAQQGFLQDYELTLRRQDGSLVNALVTATAVRDEAGAVTTYRGIIRDVTEQKNLERQLLEAQKMEAVGLLAGGVAHDFNNLLMVIQGNAELELLHLGEDDPMREALVTISEAGRRATTLVQQLLAFSRRQILNPSVVDVDAVLTNFSRLLGWVIGEDIKLELRVEPEVGRIFVDETTLEQVVMNLAVNARDAMPEGGMMIIEAARADLGEETARSYPDAQPGQYVRISVSDSGVGMSPEVISRIFEPFFSTKRDGTGLGLSIVYGIVRQQEGFILVTSDSGSGTRFDVYLPRLDQESIVVDSEAQILPEEAPSGSETILLAEDEAAVRDLLRTFLETHGYTVLLAEDGQEALEVFTANQESIDMVVMDAVMPRLTGPRAYERMIKLQPGLRCLFVTGYSQEISRKYLGDDKGVTLLRKPVDSLELCRTVRRLLDQPGGESG